MDYTIIIFPEPDGEGDYIAEVPQLRGCSAFGSTPKEALEEIETAMALWIETAKKHGKPIPKPRSKRRNKPCNPKEEQ